MIMSAPIYNPALTGRVLFAKENEMLGKIRTQGYIGRQFSYTKKGPGRIHNHSGSERKFKDILKINDEFDLRIKYGRFSKAFIKRWNMYWPIQL